MSAGGPLPAVFLPVLKRVEKNAAEHFGLDAVRLHPVDYHERPFSHLLRMRVCGGDGRTAQHLFVKVSKAKDVPGGVEAMRDRVARDFEVTRRVHEAMLPFADLGAVPPVACYPDLLAMVTEEVVGPTLLQYLQHRGVWLRGSRTELFDVAHRVGRWVRVYQATGPTGGRVSPDALRAYIDHRLAKLVAYAGITPDERMRILQHIDALCTHLAPEDMTEVAVHSDLALGNILVSGGRIVVLDFAMSKLGTRLHDVTRLYVQLDLLSIKPQFRSRLIRQLQQALLNGFDPELRTERPLFRLLCLLHRTNHLTTLTVNDSRPAEAVYNAFIRRRHRRWIKGELAKSIPALQQV